MLYYLLYNVLAAKISWLRIFGYTSTRVVAAAITALLLSFLIGPWFIERLKARQIGETIRSDGPQTHKKKAGTPTMGGSLILFCLAVSTLLWADLRSHLVWLALSVTVGFGMVGFADDYTKVAKKNKKGVSGKLRLLLEFAIAGAAMGYLMYSDVLPADMRYKLQLPFGNFADAPSLPAWLYVAFASVVIVGTANAVNMTDGLDGLAIGPSIMNAGTFLIFAYIAGSQTDITANGFTHSTLASYLHLAHIPGAPEVAVFCAAFFGAGVGFLWYNTYPAQVFMGDVGALSLGGAIGVVAVLTKHELTLLIVGGLFVFEMLSVIIQVSSFKTRGKRVFRMAPIHHHYELKGWEEPKIIVRFWLISLVLALVALGTIKLH